MSTKNKTLETTEDAYDFIRAYVDNEQKRQDSFKLIELMEKWSGFKPKMWGSSIIGFGSYHYKYASGHEGDSILIGFSPRKAEFSLYALAQCNDNNNILLEQLGKIKKGKACIYFKKLSDINTEVLEKICKETIRYINEKYECTSK